MSDDFKFVFRAERVSDFIDGTINKLRNTGELFKKVADYEIKEAQNRIHKTKTDPEGKPWAPWAPSTRKARQREGTASTGLLFRSGKLYNSFESKIANKSMSIYNTAGYGQYLQAGTDNMPARPFLGWSKKSKQQIEDIILTHFDKDGH
jgi:phage virion morphogenesis protein